MKKFKCTVCGYVAEGNEAPDTCPMCKVPKEKFVEIKETDDKTAMNLSAHWDGETEEAGMYLAYAKKAEEEGYHAAQIFEIQGHVKSTKENLAWRVDAELGAKKAKAEAAIAAGESGQHDAAEFFARASKDEGRHAAMFEGLLKRYCK